MQLGRLPPIRMGALEVRPASREAVWPGGREVLQPRVMEVLALLALRPGEVTPRDELIDQCWDGRIVTDDAINLVISKLRKLAERTGGAFGIETIAKVGYRLVAETEVETLAPAPRAAGMERRTLLAAGAATAAVAAACAGGWLFFRAGVAKAEKPLTVAVLPFDDLSPGGQEGYLAAGLAREVRNALSRVSGVRVIADTSSLIPARTGAADAARRVGADLALTGSVNEDAGQVRISLELLDPASGVEIWTQNESGRSEDLFGLLDQVSGAAIQALAGRIGPDKARGAPPLRRGDPNAFRLVMQATQLSESSRALRMRGHEDDGEDAAEKARDLANAALQIDPGDPGALLVLANITRNGWTRDLKAQPLSQAQRAAASADLIRKALKSDPNDPAALTALGDYYRRFEWRWDEAENLFRRAVAANPSLPDARWSYAYELGELGRTKEALVHAREVARLDPQNPYHRIALPRILYTDRQRDEALKLYDVELASDPSNSFLVKELYLMHLAEGDAARLRRVDAMVRNLWGGKTMPPKVAAQLPRIEAGIAALGGQPQALQRLVDADVEAYDADHAATREGRATIDLLYIYAVEYAWCQRTDAAIRMLARALAGGSLYWVATLPYGPAEFPRPMRADPRYQALWKGDARLAELVESRRRAYVGRRGFLGALSST